MRSHAHRGPTTRSSGPPASVAGGYPRGFAARRPLNVDVGRRTNNVGGAVLNLTRIGLLKVVFAALIASSFGVLSGCYSTDSLGRKIGVWDPLPDDVPKGYAEFHLVLVAETRIFIQINVRRTADKSGWALHGVTSNNYVRIAAPPGLQEFTIGGNAQMIPITDKMVTPVDLVVETVDTKDYRRTVLTFRVVVRDPVPPTPLR